MGHENIELEASAFDQRIRERVEAGFIPDLRRAVRCDFFYKSFWREPYFINIYIGGGVRIFLDFLSKYSKPGAKVLDAGCGTGYVGLELARSGYHVKGIDISSESIKVARKMNDENPFKNGFGSLEYDCRQFLDEEGVYDVVLFSGVLHHLEDCTAAVDSACRLLKKGGLLICREPCHRLWRQEDAAQVAFIRSLLSLGGVWYDAEESKNASDEKVFSQCVTDTLNEYVEERDKSEAGQSPLDNTLDGEDILGILEERFDQLENRPGESFIYRVLGGLRGEESKVRKVADLLALYDRFSVDRGYMKPNYFYYVGRKKG